MKKHLLFLTLLCLVLVSPQAIASHIIGGDVEYTCIGPRVWKVKLTMYRDCTGVALCSSMSCPQQMVARPNTSLNPVGCNATPNQVFFTLNLIKVEDISKSVRDFCGNSAKNGCTNIGQVTAGPYSPSVEKLIFEGTLNLSATSLDSSTCKYWDLYWELCCRNPGIFNLVSSNSQSFRIGATLNIFDKSSNPCRNNSPILKNEPVIAVCANQEIVYNMGGVDPDGDFLTYEIANSLNQGGTSVAYAAPGSPTYPFPLNATKAPHVNYPQPNGPYVIIDSITGYISFNGVNNTATYIPGNMNIRVKQWTNDSLGVPVLVGITHRDVQMILVNCPVNDPPKISVNGGIPSRSKALKFEVNPGQQLCFTITAKDSNINPFTPGVDTTYISWDSSLVRPGRLTFGPNYPVGVGQPRPREDQWQFCWQTDSTDSRDLPYTFTLTAFDKSCPSVGRITQSIDILIKSTPTFSSSKSALLCGRTVYKLYKTKLNTSINSATLQIANAPNDKNFTNGFRSVSPINVNPTAAPSDTLNQPRLMLSDTFAYLVPGKYYVRFCYNKSTPDYVNPFLDSIEVSNNMAVAFVSSNKPTAICSGDSILLFASFSQPNYTYQWFKNNVAINNAKQSSLWVKTTDTYVLVITDTVLNCINYSNPITPIINPLPTANFSLPTQCTKLFQSQPFIDSSSIQTGSLTRTWQFGGSINSADTTATINKSFSVTGAVYIKLVSISNMGCKDSVTKPFYVEPLLFFPSSVPSNSCQKDTTRLSVSYAPNYYTYQWFKNNVLVPSQNSSNYGVTESGRYAVLCINSMNNCRDTGGVYDIVFNPKPIPLADLSSRNLCIGNASLTYSDSSFIDSGSYTRLWRFGDGTTSTASSGTKTFASVGSYTVKLLLTSDKNCKDSSVSTVHVNSAPTATIIANAGTSFCEGKSLLLSSTYYPNATYGWYLNNQLLNNADTNNLSITLGGVYRLVIDNGGLCKDTSSNVNIQSKPSPRVGFTINNDKQCLNGNSFTLTDTSFMSSGSYTRSWNWGSNTSSLQSLTLNFSSAGTYPIKLKATSSNGCSDSITRMAIVAAQPSIGVMTGATTVLDTQLVYDYSVTAQSNHTYTWSVTNGIITLGQGTNAIKIKWINQGTALIKALITTVDGCRDSVTTMVSVGNNAPGVISFSPQTGSNGTLITINGSNLLSTSAVLFGGVNAKNYTVVSASAITATVDTGSTGNVTVITPNGTAFLNGFIYVNNTGIAEYVTQSYSIFPNPISAEMIIDSDKSLNNTRFELMDLTGKVLLNTTCHTATNRLILDVKTLSPAVYLLRITSQGQISTVKLVKH
jgi:hypothetical protein